MAGSLGCGCLMWLFNMIGTAIRNSSIKRRNRRARGVNSYGSISPGMLFPPGSHGENVIVSGGDPDDRLYICETLLRNAYSAGHPVIILHTADGAMENLVARNGFGTVVSSRNKVFDAFVGLSFDEIVQIVTETGRTRYGIQPTARYVLQVVYELLINSGRRPYFSGFAKCPYFQLNDEIFTRQNSGAISQTDAEKLSALLMTGQAESPKIDTFFSDMRAQIGHISAPNPSQVSAVSVLSAITKSQILCIDMQSSTNTMLMELIINSLIIAMNRGLDFTLLIDDISFVNNDTLKNTVSQRSNHRNVIAAKDLYALTGGKEDVFSAIIGEADKTVLFSHSSSISCEKWSKYLGEYDKIDTSFIRNGGWSMGGRASYNRNQGQNESLKREAKVKAEVINGLSRREAIIYDYTTGNLAQTFIT